MLSFCQVGTLLLICTFFFDIFWVFISPVIFKKSVMIEADLPVSASLCCLATAKMNPKRWPPEEVPGRVCPGPRGLGSLRPHDIRQTFSCRPMVLKIPALDGELPGQFKAKGLLGSDEWLRVSVGRSWASVTLPFPGS